MAQVKKKNGKTTFRIDASEGRRYRDVVELLWFINRNRDETDETTDGLSEIADRLVDLLPHIEKPAKAPSADQSAKDEQILTPKPAAKSA